MDIPSLQRRVAELMGPPASPSEPDARPPADVSREQLQEFSATLEELRIAEEELRVANEALAAAQRETEEEGLRYWDLFHFAPVAYLVTTPGGTIREANRAASELLGVSCRHLEGKPLVVYVARSDRRGFHSLLEDFGEAERPRERELRLAPRGGGTVPVSFRVTPQRGIPGEPPLRWLIRDLSELRHAQERERLLAAERAARADAEAANRTKSEFLATISHELRTPLTAIMGYVELLEMGIPEPLPAGSLEQVERIDRAARHQLQLVEEILTFTRLDAGKERVRADAVDLRELAQETAGFVRPLAERRGLALRTRHAERPVTTWTDRDKVRQILLNLLSNAVKFTRTGEVVLEVEDVGDAACVCVRDTGIGIAPEHLDRVFEQFWQVDQGTTRCAEGTGLGLSICRRMADLLQAEIRVRSSPGEGSTFTLVLPRREPSPQGA